VHLVQLSESIEIMTHVGGLHKSWGHKGLKSALECVCLDYSLMCFNAAFIRQVWIYQITKSLIVMDLQWLCLGTREADQRQCPPIYLINVIQIGPDMQVYQRLYWNNYLYILYNSNLEKESINCDAFDEAWKRKSKLSAQPHSHKVLGWLISPNSPVPALSLLHCSCLSAFTCI
jgi:hypothetical protein